MNDALTPILAAKREHVARCKAVLPWAELERRALAQPKPRGFTAALTSRAAKGQFALIAEMKRRSPSGGEIRPGFDPANVARAYRDGGAVCLSVLTDEPYFGGRDEDLAGARDAVPLPALRKDFVYDTYQVTEARAYGADCILVIMASVDDACAAELEAAALTCGMDVLVEVHDEAELSRALRLKSRLIGINNRNLKTFETTLATSERLARLVPPDRLIVGESGIFTPDDLARLGKVGISTFLVGESLMRERDVAAATSALLARKPAFAAAK